MQNAKKKSDLVLFAGLALLTWGALPLVGQFAVDNLPPNIARYLEWFIPHSDSPFKTDKLTVLLVYQTEFNNPEWAETIINSSKLREEIKSRNGVFRALDANVEFTRKESANWKALVDSVKPNVGPDKPIYLAVGNGKRGETKWLTESDTQDSVIDLVTKYAN